MELNLTSSSGPPAGGVDLGHTKHKKDKKKKKSKKKSKSRKDKAQRKLEEARAVADRIGALISAGKKAQKSQAASASASASTSASASGTAKAQATTTGERKAPEPTATTATSSSSSADEKNGAAPSAKARPTFKSLGVCEPLCEATEALGWKHPSAIQCEAIPVALQGRDIVGLAETGSGKTGAFAIPVLQALLAKPQRLFACVLAPTRELAMQISEQFEALGSGIGAKTVVLLGGVDMMAQAVLLAKRPHIIVATPGRLVDHLENTKGFNMRQLKYLIMDEADRMLGMDFEEEINKVLAVIPRQRNTYLFSATMTSQVAKLQRASLSNPVKCEVSTKYQTVSTLVQQYIFLPIKYKETYLAYVLNEFAGQSGVVFVSTCATAQKITLMLRNLGFGATCLHGQMGQHKRLAALNKFKAGDRSVLVATDVASRGLDIPTVDLVLNYDVPNNAKDYVHRVGRTARAGRSGRAITFVTQYDVWVYQRIEELLGKKLPAYPCEEETVLLLLERVTEAARIAALEVREHEERRRGRRRGAGDEDAADVAARVIRESQMKRKRLTDTIRKNSRKSATKRRRK